LNFSFSGWLVLVIAVLVLCGGAALWTRAEGTAPSLSAPESLIVGNAGAAVHIEISDEGSGLRTLEVVLVHPAGEIELLQESYPGNLLSGGARTEHTLELELNAAQLREIDHGTLRISVRDWAWRSGGSGNEMLREIPLEVDLVAPQIEISTGLTYVMQGGSGAVAYRLSEPVTQDGVQVGEDFFPGFAMPGGATNERIALFAVPATAPDEVAIAVVADDAAANASRARWPVVVKPRAIPEANVTLTTDFIERIVPRFSNYGVTADGNDATAFDDINTRVREENEASVREYLTDPSADLFREARFEQLRNSKVTSRFGEQRVYFLDGRQISSAVHYGYDLASYAAAPITAAAAGRVAYAGELGIYGNCVLIDHGLGLATLYGHLSRIDVAAQDRVAQGERLGLSGATGLAGGDHLHFAVLIGDIYVDPIEWWDAKWVKTHVHARLPASAP